MSQDEGMSASPVETLESAVGLRLTWTGESDMPSFCEVKEEPEFKLVQGNCAFF